MKEQKEQLDKAVDKILAYKPDKKKKKTKVKNTLPLVKDRKTKQGSSNGE